MRPRITPARCVRMRSSVSVSTLDSASSRIRIRGSRSNRARDRGALLLAAGKRDAALADHGLVARRESLRYRPPGPPVRRRGGSASGVASSTPNAMFSAMRGAEQERLLRHEADLPPQLRRVEARAGRCRPAARAPSVGSSRRGIRLTSVLLPDAGVAHHGDGRAGGNAQIDAVERATAAVIHRDAAEFDLAAHRRRAAPASGGAAIVGLLAQNLVDALQRRAAALHQVHHPAQRDHGPHQHAHVGVEHDEAADRNACPPAPAVRPPTAPPGTSAPISASSSGSNTP